MKLCPRSIYSDVFVTLHFWAQGFFTLPRPEPFAAFCAPTGVLAVKVLLAKLVKVFWYLSDLEAFHDIS